MAGTGIPLCWTGDGGVNYSDGPGSSGLAGVFHRVLDRISGLSSLSTRLIFLAALTLMGIFIVDPTPRLRRVTDAPPYIWPKNCPKLPIQLYPPEALKPGYKGAISYSQIWPSSSVIPCACADEAYRIRDYRKKYGLMKAGRGPAKFYRVGLDAVQISEKNKNGQCYKSAVYRNFFEQENSKYGVSRK
jgi:hypothetical protein